MKTFLPSPRLVLPLTVLIGVLVMGMRVADMMDTFQSGKLNLHPAQAEESAKPADKAPAADSNTNAKPADAPAAADTTAPKPSADAGSDINLPPPADLDESAAEMDVLKQLSQRREQIEKRAHDLDTREALLKVTEQRVDTKIKEMETLRVQLQSMVNTASEAQQAQQENLVKIYETMKPEDAAHIFEKLDMPVLLGVVQRMKPKSTAPIMAKMAPEKAKEITDALTKQDQLPQIK